MTKPFDQMTPLAIYEETQARYRARLEDPERPALKEAVLRGIITRAWRRSGAQIYTRWFRHEPHYIPIYRPRPEWSK